MATAKTLLFFLCALLISSTIDGQSLTRQQIALLKKNAWNICVDSNFSKANWNALAAPLKNKRLILLGEFNHGSREIFALRNSLITYLHEKMGVKTILLESGIGELITADLKKDELTAVQMTNGLFSGWRTREFTDLMAYAKAHHLSIAGFDVQRTGGSFAWFLKELAQQQGLDSTLYANLEDRYGALNKALTNKKAIYDSLKTQTAQLIADYRKLSNALSKHENAASKALSLTLLTLDNRVQFLTYMLQFVKDKNWSARWAARDAAMAANVEWLLTHVYPNEPVVIIAHNYHIARFNERESVMGEMLAAKYGDQFYALGFFAQSGSFADNFGKEEQMLPADTASLDIKHLIAPLPGTVNYLNLAKSKKAAQEWLDREITVNDTFIDLNSGHKMILPKSFDGLILIDKVSPPRL